jgi:adenine-specific DNA methylase
MSFIEKQFPISKLSKESYKERKANNGQTLTGLGKWWGRKPLVLVRATILGCVMPCSDNPKADMDIFLKIMSMDNDGLIDRKQKPFSAKELYEIAQRNKHFRQYLNDWFEVDGVKVKIRNGQEKNDIEMRLFKTLGYDDKLKYCVRPEQLVTLRKDSWNAINHHLGTSAKSLSELIKQLSMQRYGRLITVGDCFSGGGSIPFEAARIGAKSYGSDLNPVAGLLTWSNINILGANKKDLSAIKAFQRNVFDAVNKEITELGIEQNEKGDRAVSYIYCVEANCPECGIKVPLAPSWVIGKGTKTVAILNKNGNRFDIDVKMGASTHELKIATEGTATSKGLLCPNCGKITPISILRGDRLDGNGTSAYGLRQWEKSEFDFREDDIYNERLYAIKYEHIEILEDGKKKSIRYYRAPNERDMANEARVKEIVSHNITIWQEQGIVPSMAIESGMETERLFKERGWSYWNHLFNARQLLLQQTFISTIKQQANGIKEIAIGLMGLNKICDYNSRLSSWNGSAANEKVEHTFYNQSLNTMFVFGSRGLYSTSTCWFFNINPYYVNLESEISLADARDVDHTCDFWVTDPPYADAINYHELSEFFLAWDKRLLQEAFPDWYTDSKRILAVRGDEHFSQTMIEIYSNLTNHMPDDGMQVVMFTHSDPAVWAQLALIMWKSGLRVTAAWNIATETDASGLKDGNYVKGTVLLVLRKQTGNDMAFLDEINSDIRSEVRKQISSMLELENKEEPNFSDPDFVLAAYAASLKVLTSYKTIEDLDIDYELNLAINNPSQSSVVKIIETAKKIAYDCVIPLEFEGYLWKDLSNAEKFYIKGLESEKHGNYQISTYQEFARGFSIGGYGQMMASEKANTARLKTPFEMAGRTINEVPDFENSLLRTVFMGIYTGIKDDENPSRALGYIKNELPNYWDKRDMIKQLLYFIKDTKDMDNMAPHWKQCATIADLLHSLVTNDSI